MIVINKKKKKVIAVALLMMEIFSIKDQMSKIFCREIGRKGSLLDYWFQLGMVRHAQPSVGLSRFSKAETCRDLSEVFLGHFTGTARLNIAQNVRLIN